MAADEPVGVLCQSCQALTEPGFKTCSVCRGLRRAYRAARRATAPPDASCRRCHGLTDPGFKTCRACLSIRRAKRAAHRTTTPPGTCSQYPDCTNTTDGKARMCDRCHEKYRRSQRLYRPKNYERNERSKREVFAHYGDKCTCCGEDQPEFLTIDHIKGFQGKGPRETSAAVRGTSPGCKGRNSLRAVRPRVSLTGRSALVAG